MNYNMDVSIEVLAAAPAIPTFVLFLILHSCFSGQGQHRLTDNDLFNYLVMSIIWPVGLLALIGKLLRQMVVRDYSLGERRVG